MKKSVDSVGGASFVLGSQFFEESQDAVWQSSLAHPISIESISGQLLLERQCVRSLCVHNGRTATAVAHALAGRYLARDECFRVSLLSLRGLCLVC
jgi:hypothetical protein